MSNAALLENAIESGLGVQIADPSPAYCSNCHNASGERYVAFPGAHDAGTFIHPPEGQYIGSSDDLFLCEPCVRTAAEVLGYKATLHANQRQEIGRLEKANAHWRQYALDLEATLKTRPTPPPSGMGAR